MAALERTVALPQVDRIAAPVAENLELDVARIAQILLDIDGRIAERGLGLAAGLFHQAFQRIGRVADLHAAPAAATRRLDDHRIADVLGDAGGFRHFGHRAIAAGHQRQTQRPGGALGFHLVAHGADMFGLGADPGDVVRLDDLGELGVLRQEAVARVDGVAMRDFGGRDDRGDVEVAFGCRGWPDAHGVVGQAHMHGIGIGGGMHRHRLDPHLVRGAMDAQRNLPAIGDQYPADAPVVSHGAAILSR